MTTQDVIDILLLILKWLVIIVYVFFSIALAIILFSFMQGFYDIFISKEYIL